VKPPAPFDGPDLGSAELGGSDLGISDLHLGSVSLDPRSLEPTSLEPTSPKLDPLSPDLGSPDSESFDSSALWLPVADLPVAETDGWLPSLAPDDETARDSDAELHGSADPLLGELPQDAYGDDLPLMLDPAASESTDVMPVHVGPVTSDHPGLEPDDLDISWEPEIGPTEAEGQSPLAAEARGAETEGPEGRDLDGSGYAEDMSGTSTGGRSDGSLGDHVPPVAARTADETPADETPGDEPADLEPADPGPAADEAFADEVPDDQPPAAASEPENPGPEHPGPDRPEVERPRSAAPTSPAASSRDERGDLEGWPGFDEQVRV
jgi:hypothetical protein